MLLSTSDHVKYPIMNPSLWLLKVLLHLQPGLLGGWSAQPARGNRGERKSVNGGS